MDDDTNENSVVILKSGRNRMIERLRSNYGSIILIAIFVVFGCDAMGGYSIILFIIRYLPL